MDILIIDVSSIAHQVPKAMQKLTTSTGRPSGIVYSFVRNIKEIIANFKFDTLIFVLDGGHSYRDSIDPNYKANRAGKVPFMDDILPIVENLPGLIAFEEGLEADDLIYTLCKCLSSTYELGILAKDYDISYNLMFEPKVLHFLTTKQQVTMPHLFMTYGCQPKTLPLFKAIYGDSSDNIKAIGLKKELSNKIKTMFLEDETIFDIAKAIPVEYKAKLLNNLKLTKPIFATEFSLSEGIKNIVELKKILDTFEIKSIKPTDLIPTTNPITTHKIKSFLLNE